MSVSLCHISLGLGGRKSLSSIFHSKHSLTERSRLSQPLVVLGAFIQQTISDRKEQLKTKNAAREDMVEVATH